MSKLSEKTTLYLNPYVKKYLQYQSLQKSRSMSDIVNEEFANLLEDYEDLSEVERRSDESTYSWELIKRELDKKYAL